MAKGFKGPGMGRPKSELDWETIDRFCAVNAKQSFIAERLCKKEYIKANKIIPDHNGKYPYIRISKKQVDSKVKLMNRRINEEWKMTFVQYRDKIMEETKVTIFQLQFQKAKEGNVPMLIWLGKQLLGQTDKVESKNETENKIIITKDDENL